MCKVLNKKLQNSLFDNKIHENVKERKRTKQKVAKRNK